MSLSVFVEQHHREIIGEFATFARTLMPLGSDMSDTELRDHAEEMLLAIVKDMGSSQSHAEQASKSQGSGTAHRMVTSGRLHADARIEHGFSAAHVIAEFRALRASVLRLYEASGDNDWAGMRRFNEAVDEALTESMTRYAAKTKNYRDQFTGILSHDLRNPLGAITAGAALLLASAGEDPRQSRVASRILRSAQRMERLIADLLDLTRTRLGGAMPLNRSSLDLLALCREVVNEVLDGNPRTSIQLDAAGDLRGEWDGDRLAQLMSNLLGNAVQHGDGSPVRLTASGGTDSVTLAVHNNGNPIPPEQCRSIFEPLVRKTVGSGPNEGSIGLGLFIARAIVMAHGGDLQVESSAGAGTTFSAVLPRSLPVGAVQPNSLLWS
jgi:signal transduction histidine kinase